MTTQDKPKPKREVAIYNTVEMVRRINFYATSDIADKLKEFGTVTHQPELGNHRYSIIVDTRYNFNEVEMYIKDYES